MKEFKKIYVWALNAKFFMGLYFTAVAFLVGVFKFIFKESGIELFDLLQMIFLAMFIALIQVGLLPDQADKEYKLFEPRAIVWYLLAAILTLAFSWFFGWMSNLPFYCNILLAIFMIAGCIAMLLGIIFEQESQTMWLNEDLNKFKG